jgi:hypothetical protein
MTKQIQDLNIDRDDKEILLQLIEAKQKLLSVLNKNVLVEKLVEIIDKSEHLNFSSNKFREQALMNNARTEITFQLKLKDITDETDLTMDSILTIKTKYISTVLLEPYSAWLSEYMETNYNATEIINNIRKKYGNEIKAFIIPTMFSIIVGKENDFCKVEYLI